MLKITLACNDRNMRSRLIQHIHDCCEALGFEHEIKEVVRHVTPHSAIVELSGPAGSGKTRTSTAISEGCRSWGWMYVRTSRNKAGLSISDRCFGDQKELVIINEVEVY